MRTHVTGSSQETRDLGKAFAENLKPGDIVMLTGELGSGKTQFVIGICDGLHAVGHVASPTFTIINEYNAPFGTIAHIDLYRIGKQSDLVELGISEYFNEKCICLIEWPEVILTKLPSKRFEIQIAHGANDSERRIAIGEVPICVKILGIETATSVCGVAVVVDSKVVSEEQISGGRVHSENLMRLTEAALGKWGKGVRDLDAVAVSVGPGSFTGLRIGMSVAKGLSYASDIRLVAVPTLRALAQRAVSKGVVKTPYILSALDARRDEVYCQLFLVKDDEIHAEWEERGIPLQALLRDLGERSVSVTGDAMLKIQAGEHSDSVCFVPEDIASTDPGTVVCVGEQMALAGVFADASTLEPKYVKDFFTVS